MCCKESRATTCTIHIILARVEPHVIISYLYAFKACHALVMHLAILGLSEFISMLDSTFFTLLFICHVASPLSSCRFDYDSHAR